MAEFVKVAQTNEVGLNELKYVSAGGKDICLVNAGGQIFAISDICSHEECNMSDGGEIRGDSIVCPCHDSAFNLLTGAVGSLPATEPIETYQVRVEGDDILISV